MFGFNIHIMCNFQNTGWFNPFMGDNYVEKDEKWWKVVKTVRSDGTPSKAIPPFWMFMFILQTHAGVG